MTEFDLIIRSGTIVDGTGCPPFHADVGIRSGKIAIIGEITASARQEIDASGMLVTPGFVDVHTHYDGQAIWAQRLIPSSQHGVTTVVFGNCGVGFAPCRPEDHDMLVSVMEGVEDIPEIVMTSGLTWDWETFPEYLDALDRGKRDIDVAAYLPHSPLRVYVMGKRGADREPATSDDLARMQQLTKQALEAGALGFATSRVNVHRTGRGEFIPSFAAGNKEILAIGAAMAEQGTGVLQVVTDIGDVFDKEMEFVAEFATTTRRPVTFTLAQTNGEPDAWRKALHTVEQANAAGGSVTAQVFPRPIGLVLGLDTTVNPFSLSPTYIAELAGLPMQARVARMRDPITKAILLAEQPNDPSTPIYAMSRNFAKVFPLQNAGDYDPDPENSILALAKRAGQEPLDYIYDQLLENSGYALFYAAIANFANGSLGAVQEMIAHPDTIVALGDGGAHYGVICDAGYPTFVLSHWTRDRPGPKFSVSHAVKSLSRDPALAVGLNDRGLLAEGYKADINILDYDKLAIHLPHMVADLPGGGRRLMQAADGYVATIVSGTSIQRNGQPTGALPGKLVRGAQPAPIAASH